MDVWVGVQREPGYCYYNYWGLRQQNTGGGSYSDSLTFSGGGRLGAKHQIPCEVLGVSPGGSASAAPRCFSFLAFGPGFRRQLHQHLPYVQRRRVRRRWPELALQHLWARHRLQRLRPSLIVRPKTAEAAPKGGFHTERGTSSRTRSARQDLSSGSARACRGLPPER